MTPRALGDVENGRRLAGGKPEAMIVDWLSHGEGIMPSSYTAPIIVDTAIKHLCP